MTCDHCDQPWVIASPGSEEVRDIFLLRAGDPDRRWCLEHAIAAGFPWIPSERTRKAKQGSAA